MLARLRIPKSERVTRLFGDQTIHGNLNEGPLPNIPVLCLPVTGVHVYPFASTLFLILTAANLVSASRACSYCNLRLR